jgi:predicted phage terminase large subunit-like protein
METPEKQEVFIQRTLAKKCNLHIFGKFFFPHIIQGKDETPECHHDLLAFLTSPASGAAIFPRGHAKSTWEKIDTLHDIVYGLEPVIMYISHSLEDAQFHFESMRFELESNKKLQKIYGYLVPDLKDKSQSSKWTNKHFETTNGINVVARGANKGRGVNIKNRRPTKIIVDDAETDEQVHSEMRRRKYHDWLYQVIIPSLDKDRGRIKVIGTVIHPEAEILKFYKGHGGIFRRAIENEKPIWWPLTSLQRIRDGYVDEKGMFHEGIGLRAFSQEYLNEPINDETSIFKREWLDKFTYEKIPDLTRLDIKMAVDPNAGQSQMADFMGICVLGRDRLTGKRYVLEATHFKGSIEEADPDKPSQVAFFDQIYSKWNPIVAGVECVLNQTALYQVLLAKGKYRLTKLSPEGRDKVNRARFVEPLVAQGSILFNASHVTFYNEMIQFPEGAHDDMVDAFVYANSLFERNAVEYEVKKAPMATAGLVNKRF